MEKSKFFISIFTLVVSIFVARVAYAVPAAPSPTCTITATVLSIEEIKEQREDVFSEEHSTYYVDYFLVELDILDISTFTQEGLKSCDGTYVEKAEKARQILFSDDYEEMPISEGQKIEANIHFDGDERFAGFELSDVKILEDLSTLQGPEEVAPSLSYWYFAILPLVVLLAGVSYFLKHRSR